VIVVKKKIMYAAIGIIIAIVVISVALIQATSGGANPALDNEAVPQQTLSTLYGIANNYQMANLIGVGAAGNPPLKTGDTTVLKVNGKPAVIYVGADYCPYCAATRWALILALDRFGNFSSLHYMTSSSSDFAHNTATFTFFNSSYSSPYITFESVEELTNVYPYKVLQVPNQLENSTFDAFDLNFSALPADERGGIPFIDFGNITVQDGAEYDPLLINKYSWDTIIGYLKNENSTVAQSIIGNANEFTVQICKAINNSASVCKQQFVKNLE
jgi:thiol-disulfide isomerase/thioredoxin